MVQREQAREFRKPKLFTYKPRFGAKNVSTYLKRGLVIALYLPLLIVVRWLLMSAHIHGDARSIAIARKVIALPHLPAPFEGLTVAFLTDFHCSALTPPVFLEQVIEEANRLKPDLILLGGDYVSEGTDYILPIEKLLARLEAPLGVYRVLGNHDFESFQLYVSRGLGTVMVSFRYHCPPEVVLLTLRAAHG